MVKVGGNEISLDQGINLAVGAAAVIDGAACMLAPNKAQNFVVGAGSVVSSKSMTRLGGTVLLNAGANSLLHGLDASTARNKQGLKVNAAQMGLVSIACFNEWRNGGDVRDDRVKIFAIGSAVAAIGMAVRAGAAGNPSTTV